jgi:hypothetical protein
MFRRKDRAAKTLGQVNREVQHATGARRASPTAATDAGIEVLPEYRQAKAFVDEGVRLVLVTGGAGTGKSTFIRWMAGQFEGATILAAPTGIAALNVGGKTLHSLCKFPPAWLMRKDIKIDSKSPVLKARLLIIDEISMVDANLLDAVDHFLQANRNSSLPFGGLPVILVGDLFQLPPVVTSSERALFKKWYSSPKFFAAKAVTSVPFRSIELTKPFRQSEEHFVSLLSKIREGRDLEETLAALNSEVAITGSPGDGSVWLCPRNVDVDRVNAERLARLPGRTQTYHAEVEGAFKESNYPVPGRIELKEGTQVVLARNGAKYVNGSVATVTSLGASRIEVRLASSGEVVQVPQEVWEQYDYVVDAESGVLDRVVVGKFTQLPVVLGWASTIHRSQGRTLDAVHLDLGAGAFETGQTYVALSRCRSLRTLSLTRPLTPSDVIVDPEATAFYHSIRN